MKWIGASCLTAMVMVVSSGGIQSAAAFPMSAVQSSQAAKANDKPIDISARRRFHHPDYRYGFRRYDRPYYPRYYARPYAYEPYPYYAPAPFAFGFGCGPRW